MGRDSRDQKKLHEKKSFISVAAKALKKSARDATLKLFLLNEFRLCRQIGGFVRIIFVLSGEMTQ